MTETMGKAQSPARSPGNSPKPVDDPPLWSPWNFETRKHDWHDIIYDEMLASYMNSQNS